MYFMDKHDPAKRQEAMDIVKQGVRKNMSSGVVWHVQGLIARAERQGAEAVKAYQMSVRFDPSNSNILRDLASLQAQQRQFDGYAESRRKILAERSTLRSNWMAYATALHLAGKLTSASSVLDLYRKSHSSMAPAAQGAAPAKGPAGKRRPGAAAEKPVEKTPQELFDESELALYASMIIEDSGDLVGALAYLHNSEPEIHDPLSLHKRRAHLLERLGRATDAAKEYEWLLSTNPENYNFHQGLLRNKGLAFDPNTELLSDQVEALQKHFAELQKKYPRATAPRRLVLEFLPKDLFTSAVDAYLRKPLRSGVPSLFKDLRPLYSHQDGWKGRVIQELLESYLVHLQQGNRFDASAAIDSESPSAQEWVLIYLAHHYDYLGEWERALKYIDTAMEHTPTLIDLHLVRGNILKHAGDPFSAHAAVDDARRQDTADRFLNTECVKYAFQANRPRIAERTVGLFLKEASVRLSMYDLQASWYHIQQGLSFKRLGNHGRALKSLLAVEDFFESFFDDQQDYHSYCARKGTMRTYVEMIKWGDSLHGHKFYVTAMTAAIEIYLSLHFARQEESAKLDAEAASKEGVSLAEFRAGKLAADVQAKVAATRAELEVALTKTRAEAAKAEEVKHEAEVKEYENSRDTAPRDPRPDTPACVNPPDIDPLGFKLVSIADPLEQAARLVRQLLSAPARVVSASTHLLAFEVYLAKNKLVLALKELKAAAAVIDRAPTQTSTLTIVPVPGAEPARRPLTDEPCFPSWFQLEGVGAGAQKRVVPSLLAAQLHEASSRLMIAIANAEAAGSVAAPAKELFDAERALGSSGMLPSRTIDGIVAHTKGFVAAAGSSLPGRIAAANVAIAVAKARADAPHYVQANRAVGGAAEVLQYLDAASWTDEAKSVPSEFTRATARAALEILTRTAAQGPKDAADAATKAADALRALAHIRFPLDTAFKSTKEVEEIVSATEVADPVPAAPAQSK